MCIAISKPKGVIIPEDVLEECFRCNKDGAGFAFVNNGRIEVRKGYFTFKSLYSAIEPLMEHEMLIHCRIATHGHINEANCHPFAFKVKESPWSFAVIHNGVLKHRSTEKKSDTSHFCDDILFRQWNRDPYFLFEDGGVGRYLVENFLGFSNKIVAMRHNKDTKKTDVVILNKDLGVDDLGCWFSNRSYKKVAVYTNNAAMGPYGNQSEDWRAERPLALGSPSGDGGLEERCGYKKNPITKRWEPRNVWEPREKMKEAEDKKKGAEKKSGNPFLKPSEPNPVTVVDFTKEDISPKQTTIPLLHSADAEIVVPRDAGVVISGLDDSEVDLTHLPAKSDKSKLKKAAVSWARAGGFERRSMNIWQMIRGMRRDMKPGVADGENVSDINIDRWILMHVSNKDPEKLFDGLRELAVEIKANEVLMPLSDNWL